jgi:hypothetical protein
MENRIEEVKKTLESTTKKSMELDGLLFDSFKNGKTSEVDLDFARALTGSLRTTVKSATAEILAHRVSTNRIR